MTTQTGSTPRSSGPLDRIGRWMPGLRVARTYERAWLPRDVIAGLVLCALLVPQGMAYAELAGLPPINGLYVTVTCLVAYAVFGPSPVLVLGPDSALSPMVAAAIVPLAAGDESQAVALAGMLALMVGAICIVAGVGRLGFIADLLSMPTRTGYLAGLAVTIVVSQLPKLLGISVDATGFLGEVVGIIKGIPQADPATLAVGLMCLAIILLGPRLLPRLPSVLVAVVAAIAVTSVLGLAAEGVAVVGTLPQGFPLPALPGADPADMPILAATALGISLVAVGDTVSTSAGFAARRGLEIDGDQELVGIGAANAMGAFFQGFPVSTSGSRTAVAEQSGARTQLTGIVAAALVLAMLLVLPGLFRNLPQSALAAIIIAASLSLFDLAELRRLAATRRGEFLVALACGLGVIFIGVLQGIVVAVAISIGLVFVQAWRPYAAVMGRPATVAGYHDVSRYPDAVEEPGLLVIRWDAPLFFANANLFRRYVRERLADRSPAPRWVVIAARPVTDIDVTASRMLVELDEELNARDQHLAFAEVSEPVTRTIRLHGLYDTIDRTHFYATVEQAVDAFRRETAEAGGSG